MKIDREINMIIIHCSATPPSMDIGVKEIRDWHLKRGWSDIGYHDVIRRDGKIEEGRPLERSGAHTKGYNKKSIGVCLIGGVEEGNPSEPQDNFTPEQWRTLRNYIRIRRVDFTKATIHGHNEFAPKACPSFDVQYELTEGRLKDV